MTLEVNPEVSILRLVANVPGTIYQYILRADGSEGFTYVSPGCQAIYELAPEELLQDFERVWATIHPDDRARVRQVYLDSARRLERFDIEFRLLPPSGNVRSVRALAQPERQANGDAIWDGLVLDISERARLEAERQQAQSQLQELTDALQLLYNHAPCGYHSIDKEGVFVRINDTELQMLGYTREEVIGKMKVAELLTTEGLQTFQANFPRFQQRGEVRDLEFEIVRKDGSTFPASVSANAVKDAAGNYLESRSIMVDITERQRLEIDRQRAEVALQEKQRSIEEMNQALEVANEELLSTNQELETTNEELQSTNEEVRIVNEELRRRTTDLNQVNAFLSSILTSLRLGMVALDAQGNILIWNREAQDLWGLWPEEVRGTPFLGLDIGLPVAQLREPLCACLNGKAERQVLTLDAVNRRGRSIRCQVRIDPCLGADRKRQGAILLMEEIEP